jgi:hypothetical protein
MLDINHPRTPIIFKAGGYTDKVKVLCQNYIFQNFEERQDTFDEMEFLCWEFVTFSEANFPNEIQDIKTQITETIAEINNLRSINSIKESGNCTVCNSEIKKVKTYVKEFPTFSYCTKCPNKIIDCLNKLDSLTGAAWI